VIQSKNQPWLVTLILGLGLATAFLDSGGCALSGVPASTKPVPAATTSFTARIDEGATAFRAGDYETAREKYHAALEQAQKLQDDGAIGDSLARLGATYQALKDNPKALDFFSQAIPYLQKSHKLGYEGQVLFVIGGMQLQLRNYKSAIQAFDSVLPIANDLFEKASEEEKPQILMVRAQTFEGKALAHRELGQFAAQVESDRSAAADFIKIGEKEKAARALWDAADVVSEKMDTPEQSIKLYTDASVLFQELGLQEPVTRTRLGIGWSYIKSGKWKEAVEIFPQVLSVAEQQGWTDILVPVHGGMGQAAQSLGEFDKASLHYEAALKLLRSGQWKGNSLVEPEILMLKGTLHRNLSEYEEGIEDFYAAALKYREAKAPLGEAEAFSQLAEVFWWLGDSEGVIQYNKKALELYKSAGNVPKQLGALATLAEVSWLMPTTSSHQEGLEYSKEGTSLLNSLQNTNGVDQIALLVDIRKKFRERERNRTLQEFQNAYQSFPPEKRAAYFTVGFTIEESQHTFQEWQKNVPTLGIEYLMAAGQLYQKLGRIQLHLRNGDLGTAIQLLELANAYHTSMPPNRVLSMEWGKDWYFLAEAYRQQKDFGKAISFFLLAQVITELLKTPEGHWAYAGLARTYADMDDAANAISYYRTGLQQLESIQGQQGTEEFKISVLSGSLYVYRGFVSLLLDLYKKTGEQVYFVEAFKYHEKMRARAFLELLGKTRAVRLGEAGASLAAKEEEIRRQLAQIHQQLRNASLAKTEEAGLLDQLQRLRENWRDLQQTAARQNPKYAQVFSPQPVAVEEVQSVLDSDSVLLEYSTDNARLILWAITRDQVQAYSHLLSPNDLKTLDDYLQTVQKPLRTSDEISRHIIFGQQLYQELVAPAEGLLRGKKRIIVVPDGPLHYVPVEALIIPGSLEGKEFINLSEVPYLIKQYQVTYVQSASILVAQQKEQNTRRQEAPLPLVAFGDPVFGEQLSKGNSDTIAATSALRRFRNVELDRLEFSGEEIRRIATIWSIPEDSPHINLRERASVRRLRELDLSQYRMLHFATHAVLGDEVSWISQPALILSPSVNDKEGVGLLQFGDILELKLAADLVVLSACKTNLGKLRGGEGLMGLTRAFLYAGASSLVVSLWEVEDRSTSILMERLYQRLKQGESKAEALRLAKLDLLQESFGSEALGMKGSYASPFYWAPFILVGNWN
jgi:CHAT domain-containing protein/Tfp pilus assembly protein PilF